MTAKSPGVVAVLAEMLDPMARSAAQSARAAAADFAASRCAGTRNPPEPLRTSR